MTANSTSSISVNFTYVFTIITLCIFIVVAFVGNIVVLAVFAYTKELQSVVNYFLVSLAFADLFTAIFPLPIWLATKLKSTSPWPFSYTLLKTWQSMDLTFCTSSIWNLCAISFDRCLAIAWPFGHRVMLTPFRLKCAVAAVWLYSICVSILMTDFVKWKQRGLLISCLSYYIPTIIIITAYLIIYISEMKARYKLQRHVTEDNTPLRRRCKQDLRMAKYMILLISCFLICWAGHFILGTYFAFGGPPPTPFLSDFIKGMTYLNSCLNPFLYGYVSPKFRAVVLGVLRRSCGRRARSSHCSQGRVSPVRSLSHRTSSTKLDEKGPRIVKETGV